MHFLKPLIKTTCNTTNPLLVAALGQKKVCELLHHYHMCSVYWTPQNPFKNTLSMLVLYRRNRYLLSPPLK